jgi:hypothetical protein
MNGTRLKLSQLPAMADDDDDLDEFDFDDESIVGILLSIIFVLLGIIAQLLGMQPVNGESPMA